MENTIVGKHAIKQPYHVIGIDTYDKNALAYCLSRRVGNTMEMLLCKTMRDENEFKQEVENLAKYFNAVVVN